MDGNFPKLMIVIITQIQEAQRPPSRIISK